MTFGTLNFAAVMAGMAAALDSGRCPTLDRDRLSAALRGLRPIPIDWDPPRNQLRSQHLNRLLSKSDS